LVRKSCLGSTIHIESLCNLAALVGQGEFRFVGPSLKWRDGSGSLIRVVAVFALSIPVLGLLPAAPFAAFSPRHKRHCAPYRADFVLDKQHRDSFDFNRPQMPKKQADAAAFHLLRFVLSLLIAVTDGATGCEGIAGSERPMRPDFNV
jgi:hypothetical protein